MKTQPSPLSPQAQASPWAAFTKGVGRLFGAGRGHKEAQASQPGSPGSRTAERLARREQVFGLVREAMVRLGVLSAGYKFKVLSLDQRGSKCLVMIDLARGIDTRAERLSQLEAALMQAAQQRFNITVKSVYWRLTDQLALPTHLAPQAVPLKPLHDLPKPANVRPRFDPINHDELAAFKQALRTDKAPVSVKDSLRPSLDIDDEMVARALSTSQYGSLPVV